MKILSVAVVLSLSALSTISFAGPEDHFATQVCYYLIPEAGVKVEPQVHTPICLEEITLNPAQNSITIFHYFTPEFWSHFSLRQVQSLPDGTYKFEAFKTFQYSSSEECGAELELNVMLSGTANQNGQGNPEDVSIKVLQLKTANRCLSEPKSQVYNYVRNP